MKKLTIKLRITLYFTLIMAVLASAMLFYSYYISKLTAKHELRDELESQVWALSDTLVFEEIRPTPPMQKPDDELPPMADNNGHHNDDMHTDKLPPEDGDKFPSEKRGEFNLKVPENAVFSVDGINMFISYTKPDQESQIHGALHSGVTFPDKPVNAYFAEVTGDDGSYYLYTYFVPAFDRSSQGAWIAGTISTSSVSAMATSLKWIMLAVPFIIIIAAVMGYLVTKRAFRPVSEITAAASSLSRGDTLDKRINFKGAKDEIGILADTFDGMLDTIESNFTKEKQFTDNASHELRTPVAVIMAQSELGLDPEATHEDRQEALESINRQAQKMNKLIHVLLNVARADNGRLKLDLEDFDLAELAEMVAEEQKIIAAERNISVICEYSEPVYVNADRMQIIGVVINLITNAVKYGKDGGKVTVNVKADGENAVCTVTDDGVGISEENLPRVWERFFRVNEARTSGTTDSMGMGLSIVKSVISVHGGTIGAESVLGEGSSFYFTLKLKKDN